MSEEAVYEDAGRAFLRINRFVFQENQNPALAKLVREQLALEA